MAGRQAVSPHFAALRAYETSACAAWQGTGGSRYTGPWGTTTGIPVLIVNSRFDPATPLASATRLHELLPNSHLLVNDGVGAHRLSAVQLHRRGDLRLPRRRSRPGPTCSPDRVPFSR